MFDKNMRIEGFDDEIFSAITQEERRIVQDLVNETFDRFKGVVEEGRGLAHSTARYPHSRQAD